MASVNPSALDLFRQALSCDDPAVLEELARRAGELVDLIEAEDIELTAEECAGFEADSSRLAAVCAVLSAAVGQESGALCEQEAHINELQKSQECAIAQAMDALRAGLPFEQQDWSGYFEALPVINQDLANRLYRYWQARGASEEILNLTRWGITPASLFDVHHGLALLFQRQARRSGDNILLQLTSTAGSAALPPVDCSVVNTGLALAEIRSSPDCPPLAEAALLRLIADLARHYPGLLAGFKAAAFSECTVLFEAIPASKWQASP
jgi:hypothetical protein